MAKAKRKRVGAKKVADRRSVVRQSERKLKRDPGSVVRKKEIAFDSGMNYVVPAGIKKLKKKRKKK